MMSELNMMIQTEDATMKKPANMNISTLASKSSVMNLVIRCGKAQITRINTPAVVYAIREAIASRMRTRTMMTSESIAKP